MFFIQPVLLLPSVLIGAQLSGTDKFQDTISYS